MPWVSTKKTVVKKKKTGEKKTAEKKEGISEGEPRPDFCTVSCSTLWRRGIAVCLCVCVWRGREVQALHRLLKWEDIIAWPPLALPMTAYDHERKAKRNRRRKIVQNGSTDYFLWHQNTGGKKRHFWPLRPKWTSESSSQHRTFNEERKCFKNSSVAGV